MLHTLVSFKIDKTKHKEQHTRRFGETILDNKRRKQQIKSEEEGKPEAKLIKVNYRKKIKQTSKTKGVDLMKELL